MGVYQLGTAITINQTFTVAGVPTDPTTVTFTVQAPDGTDTAYVNGLDPEVSNPDVGVYQLSLSPPALPGEYHYSIVGTGAVEATGSGEFTVLDSTVSPTDVGWAVDGPCTPWCDANDIWVQCGSPTTTIGVGTTIEICPVDMMPYAQMASWLLWELSGRMHSGRCTRTVRPCSETPCGFQRLSRGYVVWPEGEPFWTGTAWEFDHNHDGCGCTPLDRIHLAGYPVREIVEVKIDGVVVPAADNWRLDKRRFLTRMADANGVQQSWPACQRMDLDDTESGTFSVTYAYGQDPPLLGQLAAAQVGCEIYNATTGQECALPAGTIRVTRQGVSIDRMATLGWFRGGTGAHAQWQTGLSLVDAFLNAINPAGLTRRPMMMAPGQRKNRFAQSVGQ